MSALKATPIPGWSAYAATPDGRIWSVETNWRGYGARELQQTLNASGYLSTRLTTADGSRHRFAVHKLIAITFLGACPPEYDQIRHLDGDRFNNAVSNLRWGNAAENAADRDRHGRTCRGSHAAWHASKRAA